MPRILCMRYIAAAFVTILLDQAVKSWTRHALPEGDSIEVLGSLLRLTHVENPGVAFGMMPGAGVALLLIPIIVILAVTAYIVKDKGRDVPVDMTLAVIASGGAANVIDRATRGTVTDMIDISFFPPVFNVADIAVTLGCGALMLLILIRDRNEKDKLRDN